MLLFCLNVLPAEYLQIISFVPINDAVAFNKDIFKNRFRSNSTRAYNIE